MTLKIFYHKLKIKIMNEKELKKVLMAGIKEVSVQMSSDMEPIPKEIVIKIADLVFANIVRFGLSTDESLYQKAFNSILSGSVPLYKLNVLNLMVVFKTETFVLDKLGYNETYINGKRMFNRCIEIPKGTRPCPNNLHHWSQSKKDWVYGN